MTVAELTKKLATMPADGEIRYVYDGAPRGDVIHVWLSRCGQIVLAGSGDYVYDLQDIPAGTFPKKHGRWEAETLANPKE